MTLTISEKGWVVIPAELRKKYSLVPGSEVTLVDYGGVLAIVPTMKDTIKRGRSLTKALLEEHRKERERGK
jgi:AbrB family looped-hinge helix DNA binding protein